MKRYKLTQKGKDVIRGVGYLLTTGICAMIGLFALIALGILIATIAGVL